MFFWAGLSTDDFIFFISTFIFISFYVSIQSRAQGHLGSLSAVWSPNNGRPYRSQGAQMTLGSRLVSIIILSDVWCYKFWMEIAFNFSETS